jgi:hypothetical protein
MMTNTKKTDTKTIDYTPLLPKLAVLGKLPPLQLDAIAWSAAHIVDQKLHSETQEGSEEAEETEKAHTEEGGEATKKKQAAHTPPADFPEETRFTILATMVELYDKAREKRLGTASGINNAWDTSNPFFTVESKKVRDLIPSAIYFAKNPEEIKEPKNRALALANATCSNFSNEDVEFTAAARKALFPETIDIEVLRKIANGEYPLKLMSKESRRDFFIAVAAYFMAQTKAPSKDIGPMAGYDDTRWYSGINRKSIFVNSEAFQQFAKAAVERIETPETWVAIKPKKRVYGTRLPDSKRTDLLALIEPELFAEIVHTAYPTLHGVDANPSRTMSKETLLHIATSDNPFQGMSPADIKKSFLAATAFYKETMQPIPITEDIEWMAGLKKGAYGNIRFGTSLITPGQFQRFAKIATVQLIAMSQGQEQEAKPNGHAHTNGNGASVKNGADGPWASRSVSVGTDKGIRHDVQEWTEYVTAGDASDKTRRI